MRDVLYEGKIAREWYDDFYYKDDGTVAMVENVLKRNKCKSVLDVGCGTGRHVIELSKKGYSCFGVDVSSAMIKKARENAPEIGFECMNMKNIKLHRKFDAIFSVDSAFCYMKSNDDCLQALASMRKLLNSDGILILQMMNVWTDVVKDNIKGKWRDVTKKNGKTFKIEGFNTLDPVEMLIRQKNVYMKKVDRKYKILAKDADPVNLRFHTPETIDLLFRFSGFKILGIYGNNKLSPVSEKNKDWFIVIGRKI